MEDLESFPDCSFKLVWNLTIYNGKTNYLL